MSVRILLGAIVIGGVFSVTANAQNYVRTVEPVPTIDQVHQNSRAQFIRAGDVSPEEYARLLEEADKIRAYQGTTYTYEAPVTETYSVETSTVYDGRPVYSGTSSQGYQIELYDTPIAAPVTQTTTIVPADTTSYSYTSSGYTVSAGDTLYGISKQHGISLSDLKSTNGLSGNTISIGQVLSIPGQRREISQNFATNSRPTLVRNVEPIPFNGIYAVLPGDTLYGIARRSCVSVTEILGANNLGSGNVIHPGQRLAMPSGHCLQ